MTRKYVNLYKNNLQLHMQSMPITTKVVSLNPLMAKFTHTTLCDKVCQ